MRRRRRRRTRRRSRHRTRRKRGRGTDKFGRNLGTKKKRDADIRSRRIRGFRNPRVAQLRRVTQTPYSWAKPSAEDRALAKRAAETKRATAEAKRAAAQANFESKMEELGLGLEGLTFARGRKSPKSLKRKSIKKRGGRTRRGGMNLPKTRRTVGNVEAENEDEWKRRQNFIISQAKAEKAEKAVEKAAIEKILKEAAEQEVAAAAKRIAARRHGGRRRTRRRGGMVRNARGFKPRAKPRGAKPPGMNAARIQRARMMTEHDDHIARRINFDQVAANAHAQGLPAYLYNLDGRRLGGRVRPNLRRCVEGCKNAELRAGAELADIEAALLYE